jgi:hypothetical protein
MLEKYKCYFSFYTANGNDNNYSAANNGMTRSNFEMLQDNGTHVQTTRKWHRGHNVHKNSIADSDEHC